MVVRPTFGQVIGYGLTKYVEVLVVASRYLTYNFLLQFRFVLGKTLQSPFLFEDIVINFVKAYYGDSGVGFPSDI